MRVSPSNRLASKNLLVTNIQKEYPQGKLIKITAVPEPYLCHIALVKIKGQRWYVFVNQYTGKVQGASTLTIQRFIREWHYFLFIPFQIGHFIVLTFSFLLLISTLTALYFSRKWYKKLFKIKQGKNPLTLFKNLHQSVEAWSVPFAFLFSLTGIWFFLERTNTADIASIADKEIPPIAAISLDEEAFAELAYRLDYDRAIQMAQRAIPNLIIKRIVPPSNKKSPIYLTGTSQVPLVRPRANRIYIHPISYQVIGLQEASKANTITWLNDIADPLYFGYWGGLTTKIIWFLAGLGITFLVGSGIWIYLKKKQQKNDSLDIGKWKYLNVGILLLMLSSMYYSLFTEYAVNLFQVTIITLVWISIALLLWYVYNHKLKLSKIPNLHK